MEMAFVLILWLSGLFILFGTIDWIGRKLFERDSHL